ncbi:glycosyltransferase family 2 protein [Mucilaginibacter terrae]|uniref:Glycosyltransferase involved in cell wall biosynthesis n=1 Tax=Mucilaginibacter terrae TaxID=1955052 RepID=A0ABU3GYC4_9SPHI|nr:glycosyltransferase family 2 protein [Mucilaginibacter terrae]MDT3404779.1 glycosyltransferase involved in cell wall biosynthesis [Mucilaginibacter terrae]
MKLSVITINYNNAAGLQKTMQSVITQTYTDFEYIVIDGGSTDGGVDVIKANEQGVNYWVSEKDRGIWNAMNKGIAVAKGEYCLFMNSGDYLATPAVLEEAVKYLNGKEIIYGDVYFIYEDGTVKIPTHEADIDLFKLTYTNLPHQATFIKTSLLNAIGGYREEYKVASDWFFLLQALVDHKAEFEKIPLIISYFDKTGVSSSIASGHENLDAVKKHYPYLLSQFERNAELRYYQLSKPHQMLKKVLRTIKGK